MGKADFVELVLADRGSDQTHHIVTARKADA
jgi:hypothetical protein